MNSLESPTLFDSRSSPGARSFSRLAGAWFLAALALYWLGNGAHSLWDRDEPRYAEATREMIADRDWIVPHFNGKYRFDKPVLIYWLMSVPMRLGGINEFSARAAQGLAGAATVALIFLLALRMGAGRAGANVAALMALLCPLELVISKAATTDAVLVLTVVGALAIHYEQKLRGFSWPRHAAFWVVIGLSTLDKGPIGPAVVGMAVLGERLWGRWIARPAHSPQRNPGADANAAIRSGGGTGLLIVVARTLLGLAVFSAVTLPWAWAVSRATNGEFLKVAVGRHVIERAAVSLESHKGPIVYYLPVALVGMFPLTAIGLAALRWGWRERRRPALRLLWCWILPSLAMFSLAKTKLPHYIAPLMPAVALVGGLWWSEWIEPRAEADKPRQTPPPFWKWSLAGAIATAVISLAVGVALPVAVVLAPFPAILIPAAVMTALLVGSSIWGCLLWWRGRVARAVAFWAGGFLAAIFLGMVWALPRLEPLRPSRQLAAWVRENAPPGTELLAADYQEPSLVFYWQHPVTMIGKGQHEEGLARFQDLDRPAALVTTEKLWNRWLDEYRGALARPVGVRFQKRFFLFQKGRWDRLVIVGNWGKAEASDRAE